MSVSIFEAHLAVKRAYLSPDERDGLRVLVDRLWPRGLSKEQLRIGWWAKELTPTPELRQAFGHMPERFQVFRLAYRRELGEPESEGLAESLSRLKATLVERPVTLIYAARNEYCNHAIVLQEWILERLEGRGR